MKLADVVEEVAKAQQAPKDRTRDTVKMVFATIKGRVLSGGLLKIPGFGTFYLRVSKARKLRLPGGREKVVPETRSIRFRPASSSKTVVS